MDAPCSARPASPPGASGAHSRGGRRISQGGARAEVFVGVGANLPGPDGAPPLAACRRALALLAGELDGPPAVSSWWRGPPVPESGQPWFVNAVARFRSARPPREVLAILLAVEARLGRVRRARWEARAIDLDLLAHGAAVVDEPELRLPHPRLAERAFVLLPLAEIAPGWRRPGDGRPIAELVAALPRDRRLERIGAAE